MIYDEEMMIKDLAALFQAALDTEIAAINTEKADALVLDLIPADKYYFETLSENLLNVKKFFVMYGFVDSSPKASSEVALVEDTTFTFQVGTFDPGEKERSNVLYKLLRYRRALRNVIRKNPDVFRGYAKISIASLKPDAMAFDTRAVILKCGIDIKASINASE